jgi:3'(2'), 5'-bisphosphate nucleotidase
VVTREELDAIIALAMEAGAAAMRYYDGAVKVEQKADHSPLTEADRAAHALIVAALARRTPDIPVISEEGTIAPFEERRRWPRFWMVDPLAGTKEFIHHNGEFTVNIALLEDNEPVLGVVYAPALQAGYSAARGLGSWKHVPGEAARRLVGPGRPGPDGVIVVESRSHPSAELEAWLRTVKVAKRVQAGSSLKFGVVAEGLAHCYPRFGPTHDWDVAAGDCVWRNAILEGQRPSPIVYNTADLLNPGFVIGVLS